MQIGGSDQWGNIINGTDLIRRLLQKEAFRTYLTVNHFGFRCKNGKNRKGAIWLNEDQLSPYDYWQFWRNTDDRDVKDFLNFFTEINTEEIEKIFEKEKNINNLKILLANEATKIVHGEKASKKAEQTAKVTFESGGFGKDLPEILINLDKIKKGISILDLIADNKILSSKSEARRVIANKGFKINDRIIEDEKKIIQLKDFEKKYLNFPTVKKNII